MLKAATGFFNDHDNKERPRNSSDLMVALINVNFFRPHADCLHLNHSIGVTNFPFRSSSNWNLSNRMKPFKSSFNEIGTFADSKSRLSSEVYRRAFHIRRRYYVKAKYKYSYDWDSNLQLFVRTMYLPIYWSLILQQFRRTHKERLMVSWLILQTRQNSKRIFTSFAYSAKILSTCDDDG